MPTTHHGASSTGSQPAPPQHNQVPFQVPTQVPSHPSSPPAPPQQDQVPSKVPTQVPPQPSSHPVTPVESPSDDLHTLSLGSLLASPVGSTSSHDQPSQS